MSRIMYRVSNLCVIARKPHNASLQRATFRFFSLAARVGWFQSTDKRPACFCNRPAVEKANIQIDLYRLANIDYRLKLNCKPLLEMSGLGA